VTQSWQNKGDDFATLWIDFEEFDSSVVIEITLYKASTNINVLAAGVLLVGDPTDTPNPKYGFTEGLVDYSLTRELSNGAEYYKQRDIVRTFTGQWGMDYLTQGLVFMRDFARRYGKTPMMIRLVDNVEGDWVVYGRLSEMPSAGHNYLNRSDLEISIIEVL